MENDNIATLEDKFSQERLEWSKKISDLSIRVKKIPELSSLMTDLYTERQRVVEYYHYLLSILVSLNKKYNVSYSERWDYYTNKSQVRYPNEQTKNNRILVDLKDLIEKRSMIDIHSKFMLDTKSTIDHIIWGVQKRLDIEKILRGD